MVELSFSQSECADRAAAIESFISDRVDAAGVDGIVLGISGGVDSATVAALAANALDPDQIHGLVLPAAPTGTQSLELAEAVGSRFDIPLTKVSVEGMVSAVTDAYEHDPSVETVGNVRARTRAVYWYLVANHENRLVLGGGNRTEWLTGYFTKYGDIAVDILPIGNLYKCQVRQLARHLDVPNAIIERDPTAELWPDQTDEGEIGIDYDTLDRILALSVDGPLTVDATARTLDISPDTVEHIHRMVDRATHKRSTPPTP